MLPEYIEFPFDINFVYSDINATHNIASPSSSMQISATVQRLSDVNMSNVETVSTDQTPSDSADVKRCLKLKYPSVFAENVQLISNSEVQHNIRITEGYRRPFIYPVPYAYRCAVKEKIDEMLASGVIRPSASEFTAPLVVTPKKDGNIRLSLSGRQLLRGRYGVVMVYYKILWPLY